MFPVSKTQTHPPDEWRGPDGKMGLRYVWSDSHPECFPKISPGCFPRRKGSTACLTTLQEPIGQCRVTWRRRARHVFAGVCRATLNRVSTGVEWSWQAHLPLGACKPDTLGTCNHWLRIKIQPAELRGEMWSASRASHSCTSRLQCRQHGRDALPGGHPIHGMRDLSPCILYPSFPSSDRSCLPSITHLYLHSNKDIDIDTPIR